MDVWSSFFIDVEDDETMSPPQIMDVLARCLTNADSPPMTGVTSVGAWPPTANQYSAGRFNQPTVGPV